MAEYRKDLLPFVIAPVVVLLLGLILLWLIMGSNVSHVILSEIGIRLIVIELVFIIIGIIGCTYEKRVILKYVKIIETDPEHGWPVDRKLVTQVLALGVGLWLGLVLFTYVSNDFSREILLDKAIQMIFGGAGFATTFGMMFLYALFLEDK